MAIIVAATDNGKPQRRVTVQVNVVIKRDEYPPEFANLPNTVNITENQEISIVFFTAIARDPDSVNQKMNYEIAGYPPADQYFQIDKEKGEVSVSKNLKTDRGLDYILRIGSFAVLKPAQKVFQELTITVKRNVFKPQFEQTSYEKSVKSTQGLGDVIIQVKATDEDKDVLSYSLETESCKEYFFIDFRDGNLRLSKLLPADNSIQEFNCIIKASDGGYPSPQTATVPVNIIVQPSNLVPVIDPVQNIEIVEATPVQNVVQTIIAKLDSVSVS